MLRRAAQRIQSLRCPLKHFFQNCRATGRHTRGEDRLWKKKTAAVQMRNITKTFGSVVANDRVWLDIYKGKFWPCWVRTAVERPH